MAARRSPRPAGRLAQAQRHWALRAAGALLLLCLGLAALHLGQRLVQLVHGVWVARDWTPVPARLEAWDEQVSSAAFSGRGFAVRRPMRALQARYVYTAAGQVHTGTRVGFAPVSDNVSGAWRQGVVRRLQAAADGAALTVWVDPARPGQSVVERSLPVPSAVFSAALLLFPCGVATAYALGALLRFVGGRGAAGEAFNRRWLLPLWALLHALPVLPILALSAPGSIGAGSAAVLVLLGAVGLAGLAGLLRAMRRPPAS